MGLQHYALSKECKNRSREKRKTKKMLTNKNNIQKNQKEPRENTEKYMNEISNNQEKVANFFKHPSIAYAA